MTENLNMFGDDVPEQTTVPEKKPETQDVQGEQIAVPAMRTEGSRLTTLAKNYVVANKENFDEAQRISSECVRRKKIILERFSKVDTKTKEAKRAADAARSSVLDLIRELTGPFEEAQKLLDSKARTWQAAENKRLADEAEAKRREEQRKLDEARQKEIDDAKRRAEELAQSGNPEEAQEAAQEADRLKEKPAEVATVEVEKVESSKGTSNRAHWKALCHDLAALVKAIAEGKAPISLVMFNQTEGDAQARACQDTKSYPGVAFKDVGVTVHR